MTSMIMTFALKFLTVDGLSQLAAKIIANLLSWASKKGGSRWEIAKSIVSKINLWSSLFLQVYEDDAMSAEEEKVVAEAIKNQTSIEKLVDLLKKPIEEQVAKESK